MLTLLAGLITLWLCGVVALIILVLPLVILVVKYYTVITTVLKLIKLFVPKETDHEARNY